MPFEVGTGVIHPSFGTGTVVEFGEDKTKVLFDKESAPKLILNGYLQPSSHQVKPLAEKKTKRPEVKITPTGKFQDYLAQTGCYISLL